VGLHTYAPQCESNGYDLDKSYGCRYGLYPTTEVAGISPELFLKTTVFNLAAGGLGKKEVDAARCRVGMATNPRFKRSDGE
jgi:hypothetical protein